MAIISQHAARQARNQEKVMAVLGFLRTSTYSTLEILGKVMAIEDRSAIFRCLQRMEKAQLVRRHTYSELGGTITLWGITATGQHQVTADEEETSTIVFNSSKISAHKLQHYLGLQELRIAGERAGWTGFHYCDRLRRPTATNEEKPVNVTRPDLLAIGPKGQLTAIEYERSLKAAVRYKNDVLRAHVERLNRKEYDFVLWIAQTPERQARLEKLIKFAVAELKNDNAWHLDVPLAEYKRFQFANLTNWPVRWQFELHRSKA